VTIPSPWCRDAGAAQIDPDGLSTVLVCAAARALYGRPCRHPHPDTTRDGADRPADAPDPAAWVVGHYRQDRFPAVVVGEPHGAAVHLAVVLGAAWLPTTAELRRVERQRDGTGTRTSRWTVPVHPDGYRALVPGGLRRGGAVITVGSSDPDAGLSGTVRREVGALADAAGSTAYHIGYRRPAAFSAAVADLYRNWLRRAGKAGDRLVVESGRLTDPSQVRRAGLVPYWCPVSSRADVTGLQEWIAGSEPFGDIEAVPEPPGILRDDVAPWAAWAAAVAFGQRSGVVDPQCRRAYPLGRVPHRHVASVLAAHPSDAPVPPTLDASEAMSAFRGADVEIVAV
jgi:hypothetical protein